MKVLIVSHNCISSTTNMGKTLLAYFRSFQVEEIAQFYIHYEEPVERLCQNYYRFTDLDALRSLFSRRELGVSFGKADIHANRGGPRTDTGWLETAYRYGEKREALGYALRETLWHFSRWDTGRLWRWVEDFGPDVVFFASGDYGFSYEIAAKIADHVGKPLAVCCVDDYYGYNRNGETVLGRWVHRRFLKTVHKTMARAGAIFTICPSLQQEYEALFCRPCRVLHTPAMPRSGPEGGEGVGIAYLGNLELQRDRQLIAIGRTLRQLDLPGVPKFLDVYSCERSRKLLRHMTPENGIRFHGAVSAGEVLAVMGRSMAVVHTESFDPKMQNIVRHSVSAKIPDALRNGPCLIAYGPKGIASMDYLQQTGAAYCITGPEELSSGLREILTDPGLRQRIVSNARQAARENHDPEGGSERLRGWLREL